MKISYGGIYTYMSALTFPIGLIDIFLIKEMSFKYLQRLGHGYYVDLQ